MYRFLGYLHQLARDRSGVAFVEFALVLPLFLVTTFAGLELANLTMTLMKVQRLANTTADIVAQNGVGRNHLTEMQMYDILDAMNVSAKPLDMRGRGRIIISNVLGVDANNDGRSDRNELVWQRFDGGLTSAVPVLGCWSRTKTAELESSRRLTAGEILYHAQVTYTYEPLFGQSMIEWFDMPTIITRTGAYRGRTSTYRTILSTEGFTPKDKCHG